MTLYKVIFALLVALPCAASTPSLAVASAGEALDVVGWPLPELTGAVPALETGDDPVYGRQVCPALTRLNLALKKSEELLLKRVIEESRDKSGSIWRLELRGGLFWWGGAPVTAADLAEYLKSAVPLVAKARGAGLWELPDFKVEPAGDLAVTVRWSKPPPFGPFLLNGAPFYRKAPGGSGGMAYECAGLYQPKPAAYGVALTATPGYKFKRPLPEIRLYKEGVHPEPGNGRYLELRYASSIPSSPAVRAPDAGSGCARTMELPVATMIVWNPKKGLTANREFRLLLTQLIPRGTLAAAGAAALGDVGAAPVPRQHPGFDSRVATKAFDMRAASVALNRLGYRRKTAGSPRLDAKGQELKLVIATPAGVPGLAEKVIVDAYSAVGIAVQVKPQAGGDEPDGVLAAFALDWPRVSFLANFHSKAPSPQPFWALDDQVLDKQLEDYAASLTTALPNFALLGAIQRRLAELEPATVLMLHKACVDSGAVFKLPKGNLSQKDPDWFRQLLF